MYILQVYVRIRLHDVYDVHPQQTTDRTIFWNSNCKRIGLEQFLANVNSRSRSLYAISRPSVVCLLLVVCVCLSVTLVHPTQAVELFGNFFTIR